MPEGTQFRNWYTQAAQREIDTYLKGLSTTYAAPLIDARPWMPDSAFFDNHHLLPSGARQFTERFGRDILPHILDGRIDSDQ
jgi:hypothetical protein